LAIYAPQEARLAPVGSNTLILEYAPLNSVEHSSVAHESIQLGNSGFITTTKKTTAFTIPKDIVSEVSSQPTSNIVQEKMLIKTTTSKNDKIEKSTVRTPVSSKVVVLERPVKPVLDDDERRYLQRLRNGNTYLYNETLKLYSSHRSHHKMSPKN
jgi:hypothetical protein